MRVILDSSSKSSTVSGGLVKGAPDSGVRASRRGVYVVSRRWLDGALNSPQALMRSTRIVPETRGGLTVGVRVFGVRPDDALAVFAALRTATELRVEVIRAGQPLTLRLAVAD